MNQEEYLSLLLKLVSSYYSSYSTRSDSKLLYKINGYRSFDPCLNGIDGKIFIGLNGYSTYSEDVPSGFFFIEEKFTNGAMLVSLLKIH